MASIGTIDMTGRFSLEELQEHISEGFDVAITATGNSMRPTFRDGEDVIVLSPIEDKKSLAAGDIVLFVRKGAPCVHRIVSRSGSKLVLRGDARPLAAVDKIDESEALAVVSGGTLRGGTAFSASGRIGMRNRNYILHFYPVLRPFHAVVRKLASYPLSFLVFTAVMYLSLVNITDHDLPDFVWSDKLAHVVMYLGTSTIFWMEWLRNHKNAKGKVLKGLLYCTLFPLMLSALLEVIQEMLTSNRHGDILDMAANATGVVLATIIATLAARRIFRNK